MFVCAADWMWSASCGPSLARSTLCAASAPLSTHRTNANCTYCSQKGVRLWSFHTIVSCVIYSIDCFWNLLLRLLPRSSSKYLIKVAMPVGRQMDAVLHDRRGHMTCGHAYHDAVLGAQVPRHHVCCGEVPVIESDVSSALHSIHSLHCHDGRCWLANSAVLRKFTFWIKNRTPCTLIYCAECPFFCQKMVITCAKIW